VSTGVDPEVLQGYHQLADLIVSGGHGMPAASSSDPDGKWLERALRARPDLAELVLRLIESARSSRPSEFVHALYSDDREAFEQLYTLVISVYYMNPKVMKAIRYPGQKPNVPFPDEADVYLEDGILEPVLQRGTLYRTPPPGGVDSEHDGEQAAQGRKGHT
jgi:hypothetical protein